MTTFPLVLMNRTLICTENSGAHLPCGIKMMGQHWQIPVDLQAANVQFKCLLHACVPWRMWQGGGQPSCWTLLTWPWRKLAEDRGHGGMRLWRKKWRVWVTPWKSGWETRAQFPDSQDSEDVDRSPGLSQSSRKRSLLRLGKRTDSEEMFPDLRTVPTI